MTLARTSAALIAGLVIVASGCGRAPVALSPSPVSQVTPSAATESPPVTTPSTEPTVSTAPPPPTPVRPSTAPSSAPGPSPSTRPSPPPLVIGSLTFPTGEVGIGYPAIALSASGGTPPYSWSISVGSLPPPLAVSGSAISGTPNASGAFSFSVKATDSVGAAAELATSINIVPALSVTGRCDASPCSVEQGCDAFCGGFGTQAGGVGPYKYAASGTLPTGTSLNGLSLAGVFSQPSGRAPYTFAVTVTDALGATGGVKAAFIVFQHVSLQGGTFTGQLGVPLTVPLTYYTGAPGAPKVALGKGALPPGATLAVNPKGFQVVISVPGQKLSGSYPFVLVLTDGSPCSASSNCTTTATVTINIG